MEKINRTVKRALDIMQMLKDSPKPLTSKEISDAMDIPVTSAFDILKTLYSEGYVEYSAPEVKSYVIGAKAFEIGTSYLKNTGVVQITAPYCEKLMQMSGATAFFAVEYKDRIIYMNKVEAPTSIRTSAELGAKTDMYASGLGKSIMACYTEDHIRRIFSQNDIEPITNFTITDADTMLEELRRTRQRGYAIDDREGNLSVFCIACAIRNYSSKPIGAISVAMMYAGVNDRIVHEFGSVIAKYAMEISHKLGFTGNSVYDQLPPL